MWCCAACGGALQRNVETGSALCRKSRGGYGCRHPPHCGGWRFLLRYGENGMLQTDQGWFSPFVQQPRRRRTWIQSALICGGMLAAIVPLKQKSIGISIQSRYANASVSPNFSLSFRIGKCFFNGRGDILWAVIGEVSVNIKRHFRGFVPHKILHAFYIHSGGNQHCGICMAQYMRRGREIDCGRNPASGMRFLRINIIHYFFPFL